MKTLYSVFRIFILIIFSSQTFAQDTFSICAVDLITGQVGSAGATCITSSTSGVNIISDVHPGVGVIHTQAYWQPANQINGMNWMNLGTLSPQQIIDSLVAHDAFGNPYIRQYGIVDMKDGVGRSAAYTGVNCNNYKNHIHKDTLNYSYSVQGNILLGKQILDSIESKFLHTPGTLACKLMAALQGGKVPGADTRCAPYGISTFSAVLRLANPWDSPTSLYLDKYVNTYRTSPPYIDPVDSMQVLFDNWGGCAAVYVPSVSQQGGIKIFPSPSSGIVIIHSDNLPDFKSIKLFNALGNLVKAISFKNEKEISFSVKDLPAGVYFLKAETPKGEWISSKLIKE